MTVYYLLKTISSIHTEVAIISAIEGDELWHGEAWEIFDHLRDDFILNSKVHYWDYKLENTRVSLVVFI